MSWTGRQLRSTIDTNGNLDLTLDDVDAGDPADDEIVVRIEATPINPSDLGLLLGPADLATMTKPDAGGPGRDRPSRDRPGLRFTVPAERLARVAGRLGQSMPVGNEGAGTVVAAGREAQALLGKRVGMIGGAMYADYRRIRAADVVALPDGATAADGASMFVNPLTALGFIETARRDGHKAIVHTAAASNLGQMLQRLCLADGIPLVNIVRSRSQADILRGIGATHVLISSDDDFRSRLDEAIEATGATVVFDAIGGGRLGSDVLATMERVAARSMGQYSRYGSDTFKQLYVYGALDPAPTTLDRLTFGFHWSVSGWLLFPFMRKAGPEVVSRMRRRVVDELTTSFASRYTRVIGLAEMLDPDVLRAYERKATGEKFLLDPARG